MLIHIALGSAAGGVARYLLGGAVQRLAGTSFPAGTLTVNVTGSLLLGVFARLVLTAPGLTPEMRALLTIGFCGGYTTFSTFSFDVLNLLERGQVTRAALYVSASVLLSVGAMMAGFAIARSVGPHAT
jgi:CrcB protein